MAGLDMDHDEISAAYTSAVSLVLRYRQYQESFLGPFGPQATTLSPLPDSDMDLAEELAIGDEGVELDVALKYVESLLHADNQIPPGSRLGHVPSGGDDISVIGSLLAAATNQFTTVASESPHLVQVVHHTTLNRLIGLFGMPTATAGGLFTPGASRGTELALIAARETLRPRWWSRAVVYVTEYTHRSATRAARAAGFRHIHTLPVTDRLTLDTKAAAAVIRRDWWRGLRPLVIVATAGSTDTGAVDDLVAVAALAHDRRRRLWLHVDAALGGPIILTDEGRRLLNGIDQADSLVVDGHKAFSRPLSLSVLLVANQALLLAAFAGDRRHYMPERRDAATRPDAADLGLDLSQEDLGLRWWLTWYVYGLARLREHLTQRLDWAQRAYADLAADPLLDTPWPPDSLVVAFRIRGVDHDGHRRFLAALRSYRSELSATTIDGLPAVRMCLTSHRTHWHNVSGALIDIHHAAQEITKERP